MPTKDKKEEEVSQTPQEPKPGISSFSLIDTPKLEVEEVSPEPEEQDAKAEEAAAETESGEGEPADTEPEETQPAESTEPTQPAEETTDDTKKAQLSSEEVKKWLKDVRPDTTKDVVKSGGPNFRLVLFILALFLVIGAVIGGIFYYKSKVSKVETQEGDEEAEVTLTPTPTSLPTGSELDLSKYSVNVLNGSGVVGEAGKAAENLDSLGFKEIKTGNAESYDFTTTSVRLKAEVADGVYEKISEALSGTYNVEKGKTSLDKDSSYDVEITVGTKK